MIRRTIALAAIVAASVLGTPTAVADTTAPCMEDMQCWNCETMGNLRCGTDEYDASTYYRCDYYRDLAGNVYSDWCERDTDASVGGYN